MATDIHWHIHMRHAKSISAPPELVWQALFEVRLSDLVAVRALIFIRSLPARLMGRQFQASEGLTLFEGVKSRFAIVTQEAPRLLEIGRIARFWQPVPKDGPVAKDYEDFAAFAEPGYAKALMSFEFQPEGEGTRMLTTTRVTATDAKSRRKFRAYWLVVRPGAGAIRRAMLNAAERRALELASARTQP
jgi:uncharacterized protein YndB with AHSA1/START domain